MRWRVPGSEGEGPGVGFAGRRPGRCWWYRWGRAKLKRGRSSCQSWSRWEKPPWTWVWPKKVMMGGALLQGRPGVAHGEDVLVFVERRAVDAGDGFSIRLDGRLDGALGEGAEPLDVFPAKLVAGPEGGVAGDGVEVVGRGEAAADAVVVAADDEGGEGADEVDDLVGAGAVADDIAEIPELVISASARGSGEDGLEGFKVAVDVGEDEGAHGVDYRVLVRLSVRGQGLRKLPIGPR